VAFDVLVPRLIVPHLTLLSGPPLCARSVLYLSRFLLPASSYPHFIGVFSAPRAFMLLLGEPR